MSTPAASPAPPAAPRGALPWGLGLLGLLFLPFANLVVSGVVQAIVGIRQRRLPGIAGANARLAANWGLTVLLIDVVCMVFWVIALSIRAQGFFPWGLTIIVWAVLGVLNLIASILGLTQALAGRPARWPAIPFVR